MTRVVVPKDKPKNMLSSIQNIFRDYRSYWVIAAISITTASLLELFELVMPYAIGQVFNALANQPPDKILQQFVDWCAPLIGITADSNQVLCVLLITIFLVMVVRVPIQSWVENWYCWAIPLLASRDDTKRAIAKILSLPLSFYDENNPGRILGLILQGASSYTTVFPSIATQLLPKLVQVSGIVLLMALIEWRIALLFLVSFTFVLGFSLKGIITIVKQDKALSLYREKTVSRTSEIITNIKTIKAFGVEDAELKRQSQRIDRHIKVYLHRIHKGLVKIEVWRRIVVQASTFSILALAVWAVMQGKISLGHFITIFTLSNAAYYALYPISQASEAFARHYPFLLQFHTFMQQPVGQDTAALASAPKGANPYQFVGKIQFNNLSFGYDPEHLVLKDIDLLIEPYQTVALVGRSGAGKSTLVKLLFRYFEPNQGEILVDGENIQNLDITHYRRSLAIVHQDVDVFNGTLLDNVRYCDLTTSFEQVQAACRLARVDEFIDDLPNGYQTVIGERGVRLSGGQRQRLGIARALLVNPTILVFDEATSSLDSESERSIQIALQSILGTRTTIIIAHRLSTVREADKIIVLDQGRIVEVGSHEELLNRDGVYHHLHAIQTRDDVLPLAT